MIYSTNSSYFCIFLFICFFQKKKKILIHAQKNLKFIANGTILLISSMYRIVFNEWDALCLFFSRSKCFINFIKLAGRFVSIGTIENYISHKHTFLGNKTVLIEIVDTHMIHRIASMIIIPYDTMHQCVFSKSNHVL